MPTPGGAVEIQLPLTAAQASPTSKGSGSMTLIYDFNTRRLSWTVSYTGLDSPLLGLHFHLGARGQVGGVEIGMDANENPSVGSAILDEFQAGDLLAGLWYANTHTTAYPISAIRGQVEFD